MKKITILSFALAALVTACENKAGNQVVPPSVQNPQPVNTQSAQPSAQPQQLATNPAATLPASNQPAGGTVALNPKHGQPGHRCDIPEGAPLNSPAGGQTPQMQVQPSPVVSQPVNTQPAANPGAGTRLNPPHGQPGHDCTIAVGQPLRN